MAGQSFPFGAWPPRSLPGSHFPALSHGHRVYRGRGGSVDLSRPVGYAQANAVEIRLAGLGHDADGRWTYLVRPVAGAAWLETPDLSGSCEVVLDSAGQWLGARPAGVEWLSATVESGGRINVRWRYQTPSGSPAPSAFGVYCRRTPAPPIGEPSALIEYVRDGDATHTFELEDGESYWFTVTARVGSAESDMPRSIGPFLADASLPAVPSVVVSRAS